MPLPLRLASAPLLGALLLLVGCPTGGPKDTEDSADSTDTGRYHPAGWSNPTEHGMAAKYQEDTCVACHGEDLTGGTSGQSCDTCHAEGWRTDCTFCHGGTDNPTGAPPPRHRQPGHRPLLPRTHRPRHARHPPRLGL